MNEIGSLKQHGKKVKTKTKLERLITDLTIGLSRDEKINKYGHLCKFDHPSHTLGATVRNRHPKLFERLYTRWINTDKIEL